MTTFYNGPECVYCAVRTGSLNKFSVNPVFKGMKAHLLLTHRVMSQYAICLLKTIFIQWHFRSLLMQRGTDDRGRPIWNSLHSFQYKHPRLVSPKSDYVVWKPWQVNRYTLPPLPPNYCTFPFLVYWVTTNEIKSIILKIKIKPTLNLLPFAL